MKKTVEIFILFLLLLGASKAQQNEYERGVELHRQKKYAEAGTIFESLINSGLRQREIFFATIDCFMKIKYFQKSLEITEKAVEVYKNDYGLKFLLGQLYNQNGYNSKAIEVFQALNKLYPDSTAIKENLANLYFIHGNILYKSKNYAGAIESYKASLLYDHQNKGARINILICFLTEKKYKEALQITKESYSFYPDESIISRGYFEILVATENFVDAENVCENILAKDPNDIQTNLNLALLFRYNRKVDKATEKYAELREKFPNAKEVYLAEIQFLRLYESADTIIARYKEYLENTPNDTEMLLGLAKEYERKKNFGEARNIYREVISNDLDKDAALNIAETYFSEDKIDSSISELKNYINNGGKNESAFLRISELFEHLSEMESAKQYLKLGLANLDTPTKIAIALGKLYFRQGNLDSAGISFDLVKLKYSEFPEISYYTANIFLLRGDTSKATFHLTRCVRHSINLSQILQYQVISSVSGENIMNADSAKQTKMVAAKLDTVKNIITMSLNQLKKLNSPQDFLSILNRLIKDIPTAAGLYLQRGKYLFSVGMLSEAESDFNTALSLVSSEEAYQEAGDFFSSIGKSDKAFECFYSAISLNKNVDYFYRMVIDLGEKLDKLNSVCDYWLKLWDNDKHNKTLKEFLIEALHKANRGDEALKIINQKTD